MRHPVDLEALSDLFAHRIAAISDLVHIGLSPSLVADRCRPGGPWQHLLPGILLLGKAPPTRAQLAHGALRYAGPRAILTGLDALQLHGIHALPAHGQVHVLIPLRGGISGCTAVHVERTSRLPRPVLRNGFLVAPPARAALDAVRRMRSVVDVRLLLDEVTTFADPTDLRAELEAAPRRGTTIARHILTGSHPSRLALQP
ncbi:hypothetical protein FKR81_21270 [Lentzea tibetensis]|uniref:AbiEi antitoxin C-terminal domain-containing protein n=1 Tax=Lentzea tibetensis TaxID=2591470 RepID=A0A563ERE9_9PSEU|nr:hypothetical protein [Lentzea tibetensis]TWP50239.1 hypothetical protein FKR81_21270 [Lentzea tibetensis]